MVQEKDTSKPPNIIIRRKRYDAESGWGYVELDIDGETHRFKVYRNPRGRGFIVEYCGLYMPLSSLRKLLKHKGLAEYSESIEDYIRSAIYEAELKTSRKRRIVIMKNIQTRAGQLEIGLRDDGKVVLRLGSKRIVTEQSSVLERLAELLPMDTLSPDLVNQVKSVFTSIEQSIIVGKEVAVILDSEARDTLLPSIVVGDKLVLIIPFAATYLEADEVRHGLLAMVIVVDGGGKIECIEQLPNPITVEVSGKTVYKDFLEHIAFNEAIERILPSAELVKKLRSEVEKNHGITWSEVLDLVGKLIGKYAYVEGRNRTIASLYTITQAFYDLIPLFPILRIIGEMGSGKRQLANVIAACALLSITVVKPTEVALYRLVDAFHPLLIIDESKINEDVALLLNAGFEKDKFVPRARVTEEGKITIDIFNFYSPKVIVSRPGRLSLPEDTISRTIEVYMQRVTNKVFSLEIDPRDHEEAVTTLLLLKIKRWREFIETYNVLRNELVGIDPRTRDTYLPLLTVAYLVAKERNDPSLFTEVLEDMVKTAEERAGIAYHQKLAVAGILKHIVSNATLGGEVKLVSISVKDVESALSTKLDNNVKIRIGRFLNEAPFKASKSRSGGYTKYVVDVEKLYHYVRSYGVDLSMLTDDELDRLEKATGLDWRSIGFNRDEWIKSIADRLFGGNSGGSTQQTSTPSTPFQQGGKLGGAESKEHGVESGEGAPSRSVEGAVEAGMVSLAPPTRSSVDSMA